jgi:hypothetical protein
MSRSNRARILGVVLLCQLWPLLAAAGGSRGHPPHPPMGGGVCKELGRGDDRRHVSCPKPRIPKGATLISAAKFRRLVERGVILQQTRRERARQRAAAETQMQEDLATILAFQRETGAEIRLPVESRDPSVTSLGPEDYEHQIRLRDGSERRVLTLGRRWVIASIADSIRGFGTRENQLAIYRRLFEIALASRADDLIAGLASPDEMAADPGRHPVAEIERAVAILRGAGDRLIGGLPILPGVDTGFVDCSEDFGRDLDSDRDAGGPACHFDPQGLFANASWTHKFDHTCVKAQGARGACVAFAVTAATELEVQKAHAFRVNLSEQALYNRMKFSWEPFHFGDGFTNTKALQGSIGESYVHPFEFRWNYNQSLSRITFQNAEGEVFAYARSCLFYPETCSNSSHQSPELCAITASGLQCGWAEPDVATALFGFQLKSAFQLWNPDTQSSVQSVQLARLVLAGGNSVLFGIPVTPQFDAANCDDATPPVCKAGADSGVVSFVAGEDPASFRGGHALLAVGFVDNPDLPAGVPDGAGGGYFIVKNSWGHCWGDGGYAYVPYEYFRVYATDADVLLGVF